MNFFVRNYHLDGYGHVNHARYLEFLEEARWTFFDEHNLLPLPDGVQLVVARIDIRYRRAAKAGDVLRVSNQIKELTARHLVLRQQIMFAESGKSAVEAEITLMPVDGASGRSIRFPEKISAFLQTLPTK
ncbi:acyl-CoA thioesterase [Neisseria animalis]|uniref:Acyl-CoA thioesterase n=1 Tax=Neisseria animalis TaxID=492 RepID=A0A5P3MR12_NEIAN|nr:thioesterase family protein [Neisseria animalis]QEY24033.1 acyl-CoA thioesterase [Neisseria animalis]ROW32601.1 acyl-CoA thioesterase [Neisseria animalis]VEE06124.1 thioesterase family protein [Neisseria animalis]